MTAAKIQHYVPQFLLRNFGTGKKDQVVVFDKHSANTFSTNAKNIASESRFYDFELNGEAVSLESRLSQLESAAKPALDSIIKADSITNLTLEDRQVIADFLSVQLVRTRAFREQWAQFPRMLREHFERYDDKVQPGSQAEELLREISENDLKAQTGQFLMDAPESFSPHLLDKVWVLAGTSRKDPFILGDHPVVLQNMTDMAPLGNLGLSVPGIEIYVPLSPSRLLVLWCPTLAQQVSEGAARLRRMPRWMWEGQVNHPDEILELDENIRKGKLVQYRHDNVKNVNALQIFFSERYLFSHFDNFELVREILNKHPSATRGARMRAG